MQASSETVGVLHEHITAAMRAYAEHKRAKLAAAQQHTNTPLRAATAVTSSSKLFATAPHAQLQPVNEHCDQGLVPDAKAAKRADSALKRYLATYSFEWTSAMKTAFELAKKELTSYPVSANGA